MSKAGKSTSSKKAAGNAKKAENAAAKAAVAEAAAEAAEADKWAQGAKKGNKKQEDAAAKKADADRKKAERDQMLAAEEAALPSKKAGNSKTAQKKGAKPAAPSRGLDLGQLEGGSSSSSGERRDVGSLNASGIDNALDALSLTTGKGGAADKVEKHPERRFKAAYAAFEARRLPEVEQENPGLRRNQRVELIRKEFEKSPENPFNQVSIAYDASKEEIAQLKASEKKKIEDRLGG